MKRLPLLTTLAAAALAACGQAVGAANPSSSASTPAATVVHVASNATLGQILTTASGRTLYYFTPERGGTIACTGQCATIWAPLLAGPGGIGRAETLPATLSTIARAEGAQVTYSEWPLYTFSGDKAAGDTNGQGLLGKWFVATPALTDAPVAASASPTQAPVAPPATAPPSNHPPVQPTSCIPGANGGDHDGDNNGAASDGDGCL